MKKERRIEEKIDIERLVDLKKDVVSLKKNMVELVEVKELEVLVGD